MPSSPDPKPKPPSQSGAQQIYETVRQRHKRTQRIRLAIFILVLLLLAGGGAAAVIFAQPQLEAAWSWVKEHVGGVKPEPVESEHEDDPAAKKPDAPEMQDEPNEPADDDAPPLPTVDD